MAMVVRYPVTTWMLVFFAIGGGLYFYTGAWRAVDDLVGMGFQPVADDLFRSGFWRGLGALLLRMRRSPA
jgi:hypothetical protein